MKKGFMAAGTLIGLLLMALAIFGTPPPLASWRHKDNQQKHHRSLLMTNSHVPLHQFYTRCMGALFR